MYTAYRGWRIMRSRITACFVRIRREAEGADEGECGEGLNTVALGLHDSLTLGAKLLNML